jgi:hypothetical protein
MARTAEQTRNRVSKGKDERARLIGAETAHLPNPDIKCSMWTKGRKSMLHPCSSCDQPTTNLTWCEMCLDTPIEYPGDAFWAQQVDRENRAERNKK